VKLVKIFACGELRSFAAHSGTIKTHSSVIHFSSPYHNIKIILFIQRLIFPHILYDVPMVLVHFGRCGMIFENFRLHRNTSFWTSFKNTFYSSYQMIKIIQSSPQPNKVNFHVVHTRIVLRLQKFRRLRLQFIFILSRICFKCATKGRLPTSVPINFWYVFRAPHPCYIIAIYNDIVNPIFLTAQYLYILFHFTIS